MGYFPADARWYLADIVLDHIIEGDPRNVVHINTHLIEAKSPENAYEKALALGSEAAREYANSDGKQVRVIFRGLEDLKVIHDALEDGAELFYSKVLNVPEARLRERIPPKERLAVFAPMRKANGDPNYMPKSVMEMLEAEGFTREDVEGRAD